MISHALALSDRLCCGSSYPCHLLTRTRQRLALANKRCCPSSLDKISHVRQDLFADEDPRSSLPTKRLRKHQKSSSTLMPAAEPLLGNVQSDDGDGSGGARRCCSKKPAILVWHSVAFLCIFSATNTAGFYQVNVNRGPCSGACCSDHRWRNRPSSFIRSPRSHTSGDLDDALREDPRLLCTGLPVPRDLV